MILLLLPVPKSTRTCLFLFPQSTYSYHSQANLLPDFYACSNVNRAYVPPEEHDRTRIIQLVHDVEVRYLFVVDDVNGGKILDLVHDLVEVLVHGHALRVGVSAEADDDDASFFAELHVVELARSMADMERRRYVRWLDRRASRCGGE